MALHVASVIFGVFVGLALLLLPGMALLQICLPRLAFGFVWRLALAPGITIAFCVLLFTWAAVFSVRLGPLISWLLVLSALFILLFLPGNRSASFNQLSARRRSRTPQTHLPLEVATFLARSIVGGGRPNRNAHGTFWRSGSAPRGVGPFRRVTIPRNTQSSCSCCSIITASFSPGRRTTMRKRSPIISAFMQSRRFSPGCLD